MMMLRSRQQCDSSIELNVATVWDDAQIARWAEWSHAACAVRSVFGSLQEQVGGHGRSPRDVPNVEPSAVVRHAAKAHELGLKFLYLLNGRCEHLDIDDPQVRQILLRQIEWIAEEVGADCVVVADLRLAALIRQCYSAKRLGIRVSTVAGVKSVGELAPWLALGIEGVVLHHDVGRDFETLARLASHLGADAPGVEIELLLNESCLPGCSTRAVHYARLARETTEYVEGFQQSCNVPRFRDPSLILAARWIRPEDISRYYRLGIRRFKIAGREMPGPWLDRSVSSYIGQSHSGNLVELFTMTPPGLGVAASDIISIANSSLSGFLDELEHWRGSEGSFYRQLASRLWLSGALTVRDSGCEYGVASHGLRCITAGKHLKTLLRLQEYSDPVFHSRLVRIGGGRTAES